LAVLVRAIFDYFEALALDYGTYGLLVAVEKEGIDAQSVQVAEALGLGASVHEFAEHHGEIALEVMAGSSRQFRTNVFCHKSARSPLDRG
jgi:hypothetical protein